MNLKKLRDEIKELKRKSHELDGFWWKLEGIKQTVEAVSNSLIGEIDTKEEDDYILWQEIKELLGVEK